MKAAGLSAHQVLAPLLLSSIAVAAISFAFDERIVTRSNTALSAWQNVDYGPVPRDSGVKTNVWVREGGQLIRAGTVVGRGTETKLGDVRVFTRLDNVLRSITAAPRGHYVEGEWQLDDAVRFDVATGREQRLGSIRIAPEVRPDQFTLSKVDPDGLSFAELSAARSEEHKSELQSLMRISYAVCCLTKKKNNLTT